MSCNYYFPCYLRHFPTDAARFAQIISMLGKPRDFREVKRCYDVLQTPRAGARRALLRCFGEKLVARSHSFSTLLRKGGTILPLLARGMEHRRDADHSSQSSSTCYLAKAGNKAHLSPRQHTQRQSPVPFSFPNHQFRSFYRLLHPRCHPATCQ